MRVRKEVKVRQRVRLEMKFGLKNKYGVEKRLGIENETCNLQDFLLFPALSFYLPISLSFFLSPSKPAGHNDTLSSWWWAGGLLSLSLSSDPADSMRDGDGGPLFSLSHSLPISLSLSVTFLAGRSQRQLIHSQRAKVAPSSLSLPLSIFPLSLSQSLLYLRLPLYVSCSVSGLQRQLIKSDMAKVAPFFLSPRSKSPSML